MFRRWLPKGVFLPANLYTQAAAFWNVFFSGVPGGCCTPRGLKLCRRGR